MATGVMPFICTIMNEPTKRGRKSTAEKGELLSFREKEVLSELQLGKSYKDISIVLFISTETVRTHAHKIYVKLQAKNRKEAVIKFYQLKNIPYGSQNN